jgi:thioredoxin reductase (NADPH)
VLVATGATPLTLNVPGAKKLVNYGIGYSITTHAHMLNGKTVAVIGTTTRALRGAIELTNIGASVYLIAPDSAGLASPLGRMLLRMPQVSVLKSYTIKEIRGTSNIEYVVVAQQGEQSMLRVDAAFADVGLLPNSAVVRELAQVDQNGFIKVDTNDMTSVPGLFAAGDVTTAFAENILVAIGSGTRATMRAYEYLLAHPLIDVAESAD